MRWLRRYLSRAYADWFRAPVSGTVMILCLIAAGVLLYRGDVQFALIWLLYAKLYGIERGPFKEDDDD